MSIDVQAIRARCEAATPGPWHYPDAKKLPPEVDCDECDVWGSFMCEREEDYDFIAHAREDIPALLSALDEAKALIREARDALDAVAIAAGHTRWDLSLRLDALLKGSAS